MTEQASSAPPTPKIRHDWYQTSEDVIVSVFVKLASSENLNVDLLPHSATISFPSPVSPTSSDANVQFTLDPFFSPIDPSQSRYTLKPNLKLELTLRKATPGLKWDSLEGGGGTTPSSSSIPTTVFSSPSSSSASAPASASTEPSPAPPSKVPRKNWDSLVSSLDDPSDSSNASRSKDPNAGGDQALNQLFQKLYADATDDQRRAMVKSYQESNGTSLSTNWSEVSKGKVETKPPDSMIAKKWGQ